MHTRAGNHMRAHISISSLFFSGLAAVNPLQLANQILTFAKSSLNRQLRGAIIDCCGCLELAPQSLAALECEPFVFLVFT